jgi:hypothetical protein
MYDKFSFPPVPRHVDIAAISLPARKTTTTLSTDATCQAGETGVSSWVEMRSVPLARPAVMEVDHDEEDSN